MRKILNLFLTFLVAACGLVFANVSFLNQKEANAATSYDATIISAFNDNENLSKLINDNSELPTSFNVLDSVELEIYDQNPFGTCYATSLAQLLNLSYEYRTGEHIKLSAMALALQVEDLFFSDGSNDIRVLDKSFDLKYISEFDFPYELANEYYENLWSTSDLVDIDYDNKEIFDVSEYYVFPYIEYMRSTSASVQQTYVSAMKRALKNQGALGIGLIYNYVQLKGDYYVYNPDYVFSLGEEPGGHAMTIIGYDDNFSASNFHSGHTSDGAFIILNSWGKNEEICYMSYEDFLGLDFIYGVADFIDADERETEVSSVDSALFSIVDYYGSQTIGTDLEIGYQISNDTENAYLKEIDLQPVSARDNNTFYHTAIDVDIYVNTSSNDLNGATQFVGSYDISTGINKIKLESPILVNDDFAIKIVVSDSKLIYGYYDRNSQNVVAQFYSNGSWKTDSFSSDNYNLVKTPFYLRTVFGTGEKYEISKTDNTQLSNSAEEVIYNVTSSEDILSLDVKVFKHDSVNVTYDEFDYTDIDVTSAFDIEKDISLGKISITPNSKVYGTYKVVISVNGTEKQFIKFLRYDDGMGLIVFYVDPGFYLRLFNTSLESNEINIEIPSSYELVYVNEDGTEFDYEQMFAYDTEHVSVSAEYEYDALSRITSAEVTFANASRSTTRTVIVNFEYEDKCKVIYVTNLPNATHSNPEYVANGEYTVLQDATAPNHNFIGWFTSSSYATQRTYFTPIVDGAIIHFYGLFEQKEVESFAKTVTYDSTTNLLTVLLDFSAYDLSIYDTVEFSSISHKFLSSSSPVGFTTHLKGSTYAYQVYVDQSELVAVNEIDFKVKIMRYAYRNAYRKYTSKFLYTTLEQSVRAYYTLEDLGVSVSTVGGGKVVDALDSSIEYSGRVVVGYNTDLYLLFIPNDNYYVSDVIVDGVSIGVTTTYKFEGVTQNHTIVVVFKYYSYSITTTKTGNGTINQDLVKYVDYGDSLTYVFTPTEGNFVESVYIDGVKVAENVATFSYTFSNISKNHEIEVTFKIYTFSIVAEVVGMGSIGQETTVVANYGTSVTYVFEPDSGYRLKEIWVDGIQIELVNTYTFSNIKKLHTLKVVFEMKINKLTFEIVGLGTVKVSNLLGGEVLKTSSINFEMSVQEGTSLQYTLSPNEGYYINEVYVNGNWQQVATNLNHYVIDKDYVIKIVFRVYEYSLKVNVVGEGFVNQDLNMHKNHGETVKYMFIAEDGYSIQNVVVNGESLGSISSYLISSVDKDYIINVYFEINSYNIYWRHYDGSLLDVTYVNHGEYPKSDLNPTRARENGISYAFDSWNTKIDGSGTDIVMATADTTYYAMFKVLPTQYEIKASCDVNGTIGPIGTILVNAGESQSFAITPNINYHISSIIVDGKFVDITNLYIFENVNENHRISVQFKYNDFTSTIVNNEEYGEVVGGKYFERGERAIYRIVVKEGYQVKSVMLNGSEIMVKDNTFVIESVSQNLNIVIYYEEAKASTAVSNFMSNLIIAGVAVVAAVSVFAISFILKRKKQQKTEAKPYK